jgi:poly(hydroxyalkanoate) depolymerase family esterase
MKFDAMLDALRLTRSGKLGEATSRLRSLGPAAEDLPSLKLGLTAQLQTLTEKVGHLKMPELFRDFTNPEALSRFSREDAEQDVKNTRQFVQHACVSQAGARDYKLFTPEFRSSGPHPLIVMLHGCTQSPDDFAAGTRMNEMASQNDCFVAYPAQSKSANASGCWNWFQQKDQMRDRGEPAIIAAIVSDIARTCDVDRSRIYIAGLSAGGAAAANIAYLYPDLFAALGVHSGLACGAAIDLPSALTAMTQGAADRPIGASADAVRTPVIVFHGDKDRTVHPSNAEQVLRHAKANGKRLDVDTSAGQSSGGRRYAVERHADSDGRVFLEKWTIRDAGHAWSGGHASGSYTDPAGPDASAEMMRFFLSHRLQD